MLRGVPLITGETYHVFNRGAHKKDIFLCAEDYSRFQLGLHLANHSHSIVVREILKKKKYREPFSGYPADKALVDVLCYALMPNHFHIVLRQKMDGGTTIFLRKLCVGYSMYFNLKYGHLGTIFQGPFKSSHIDSDPYLRWIFAYVHLNPIGLIEAGWKEKQIDKPVRAREFLEAYSFSSYHDFYAATSRPEKEILAYEEAREFVDSKQDSDGMINEYARGRDLFS